LCVVYTGWYALSLLEMRHVFSMWAYILMCLLTFLTGVVTGVLHKHALENIRAEYTELSSWSLILTGAAVIHGILVAAWLVNGGDLMLLLNYAAILYIYILAVYYWASYANDQAREQVKVARN